MAVAVPVYADWIVLFPELSSVSQASFNLYWVQAGLLLNNTDCSVVQDVTVRLQLLYILTAHVATLAQRNATGGGIVGVINTASEGDVSVSAINPAVTKSSAWYLQTQYGATYWQMTVNFRTMQYAPGAQRSYEPLGDVYLGFGQA